MKKRHARCDARGHPPVLLKTTIQEAVSSLYATKQRSFPALVGIIMGVGSVIAMISVGSVVKFESLKQFRELGTDVLTIRKFHPTASAEGRSASIRLEDAVALADRTPSVAVAAPWVSEHGEFTYAGREIASGQVLGVTESFADLNKLKLSAGRFLSDLDFRRSFCVLGAEVAQAMRRNGATQPVGVVLKLRTHLYTVVGVLRPTYAQAERSLDVNRSAFIPITTAQRTFSKADITRIIARMQPTAQHTVAAREIETYFRQRTKNLNIEVTSARQLIDQMQKQSRFFVLLLGTVGSISLIVGGIGVMNVMLASVAERRKEIGLRRALGARRRDIQSQFLIESVILSLLGGLFGVGLGLGSAYVICQFSGWPFMLSVSALALGVGVASCVGIFFGFYPARQAARLDPIAALRAA